MEWEDQGLMLVSLVSVARLVCFILFVYTVHNCLPGAINGRILRPRRYEDNRLVSNRGRGGNHSQSPSGSPRQHDMGSSQDDNLPPGTDARQNTSTHSFFTKRNFTRTFGLSYRFCGDAWSSSCLKLSRRLSRVKRRQLRQATDDDSDDSNDGLTGSNLTEKSSTSTNKQQQQHHECDNIPDQQSALLRSHGPRVAIHLLLAQWLLCLLVLQLLPSLGRLLLMSSDDYVNTFFAETETVKCRQQTTVEDCLRVSDWCDFFEVNEGQKEDGSTEDAEEKNLGVNSHRHIKNKKLEELEFVPVPGRGISSLAMAESLPLPDFLKNYTKALFGDVKKIRGPNQRGVCLTRRRNGILQWTAQNFTPSGWRIWIYGALNLITAVISAMLGRRFLVEMEKTLQKAFSSPGAQGPTAWCTGGQPTTTGGCSEADITNLDTSLRTGCSTPRTQSIIFPTTEFIDTRSPGLPNTSKFPRRVSSCVAVGALSVRTVIIRGLPQDAVIDDRALYNFFTTPSVFGIGARGRCEARGTNVLQWIDRVGHTKMSVNDEMAALFRHHLASVSNGEDSDASSAYASIVCVRQAPYGIWDAMDARAAAWKGLSDTIARVANQRNQIGPYSDTMFPNEKSDVDFISALYDDSRDVLDAEESVFRAEREVRKILGIQLHNGKMSGTSLRTESAPVELPAVGAAIVTFDRASSAALFVSEFHKLNGSYGPWYTASVLGASPSAVIWDNICDTTQSYRTNMRNQASTAIIEQPSGPTFPDYYNLTFYTNAWTATWSWIQGSFRRIIFVIVFSFLCLIFTIPVGILGSVTSIVPQHTMDHYFSRPFQTLLDAYLPAFCVSAFYVVMPTVLEFLERFAFRCPTRERLHQMTLQHIFWFMILTGCVLPVALKTVYKGFRLELSVSKEGLSPQVDQILRPMIHPYLWVAFFSSNDVGFFFALVGNALVSSLYQLVPAYQLVTVHLTLMRRRKWELSAFSALLSPQPLDFSVAEAYWLFYAGVGILFGGTVPVLVLFTTVYAAVNYMAVAAFVTESVASPTEPVVSFLSVYTHINIFIGLQALSYLGPAVICFLKYEAQGFCFSLAGLFITLSLYFFSKDRLRPLLCIGGEHESSTRALQTLRYLESRACGNHSSPSSPTATTPVVKSVNESGRKSFRTNNHINTKVDWLEPADNPSCYRPQHETLIAKCQTHVQKKSCGPPHMDHNSDGDNDAINPFDIKDMIRRFVSSQWHALRQVARKQFTDGQRSRLMVSLYIENSGNRSRAGSVARNLSPMHRHNSESQNRSHIFYSLSATQRPEMEAPENYRTFE